MRVVIIGASTLGLTAADMLLKEGAEVVIVEKDGDVIEQYCEEYDCSFVHGDGSRPHVLEDVDPEHTDCLYCLSNDDTANILAGVLARKMSFDRVVVRIEEPELLSICDQLDLEHVIIPDRRVGRELVAFAAGDDHALDTESSDGEQ